MKKILLSLLALGCFSAANAQTFRFGPTVGGNLNISDETKTKIGFAVGAKAEMNFNNPENGWFMDASVLFNNRNRQSEKYYNNEGIYSNNETKLTQCWKYSTYSLLVPVNVGYKFRLSDNLNLLAAVGPYADFGLTGTDKVTTTDAKGHSKEEKISSNVYGDKLFNRVNFGFDAKVGVEIAKHYQLSLSYSRGFTNIFKGGLNTKPQDLQLGFSYMF